MTVVMKAQLPHNLTLVKSGPMSLHLLLHQVHTKHAHKRFWNAAITFLLCRLLQILHVSFQVGHTALNLISFRVQIRPVEIKRIQYFLGFREILQGKI